MLRKITIVGTGYVGLVAGACFAYLGHNVVCVDKDKNKIKKLKKGIVPIFEVGLGEILKNHRKNIEFTQDLEKAVKKSEVIFITVGTPQKKDGSIDMSYFEKAIKKVGGLLNNYKVIVNKSTVLVGTGDWTKKEIKKHYRGDFSIVSNPEFLREGSALKDFLEPDRIIIGAEDENAKEIILDIYSSIQAPKIITDIRSAELIKYASNAFLATKISFINEIANICERVKGDVEEVAKGIGCDKRIGARFLNAGIGYGGSCLPKDTRALHQMAGANGYNFRILKSAIEINNYQKRRIIEKIKSSLPSKKIKNKTIAVLGLAFKGNTDDVRESASIEVIQKLQELGAKIKAYDPQAIENAKKTLNHIVKFYNSPYKTVENCHLLLIATEWKQFKNLNWKRIKNLLKKPIIVDGRNLLDPIKMKKLGFRYVGVGRNI